MQGMSRIKIISRDNPQLKEARKVRDGKVRQSIFIEGLRLAEEAVSSQISIDHAIVRDDFGSQKREADLLDILSDRGVRILETDERSFASIADTKTSQGILIIADRPRTDEQTFENLIARDTSKLDLIVLLDQVNNPSNLGAVLRTAEAAGAKGVIVTTNSVDAFGAKAIRASMGSAFRIPIWNDAASSGVKEFAARMGFAITAISKDGSVDYLDVDWNAPMILAFGSETHGLSKEIETAAQVKISIPINAQVESLNLAVAAGIILFEARRQLAID